MTAYAIPVAAGNNISANGTEVRSYSEVVDFSTQTNGIGDTFDVINVPAGSVILGGTLEVLTLDAGAGTLAMSAAGVAIVAASTAAATGFETSIAIAPTPTVAASTVRLTNAVAVFTTAKVRVTVFLATGGVTNYHPDGNDPQSVTMT